MTESGQEAPRRLANLRRLLRPRHVAFVGGREAARALGRCLEAGFAGEVWPVHPRHDAVEGRRCYRSIAELPAPPDAAFVAVRREATLEVVRELAAAGAGGCVCYAAGFAESGAAGAALQDALAAAAGDLALIGPNCYGFINYLDGLCLWHDIHGGRSVARGVAIVSQSGNIALNLTMSDRSVPLALVISVGNQAVTGLGDCVAALIEDPRIAAIGLYVEGVSDVAGLSRAAAAALDKRVPLVALAAGSSESGRRIALSHTASLAGAPELARALFRRLGIVQVANLTQFLETLKLLAVLGPLDGGRLALLTCSGGEAALVADLAGPRGLRFAELSAEQHAALAAQLPAFATVGNPLDYNTSIWGDRAALEACFATMMDGAADITLLVLDRPRDGLDGAEDWDPPVEAMIAARRRTGRPAAVASSLPELLPEATRERLIANGLAPLQGLDEAVTALAAAAWYGGRTRGRCGLELPAPARLPAESELLDEWASKRLLRRYRLAVPDGRLVAPADAPAAAAEIGFPVALKALGLAHKTEAGAVALDLADSDAVAAAADRLSVLSERIIVESMVAGTLAELLVGVTHHPCFGLALVIGAGGALVELIDDTATLLLPCDRAAIAEALAGLKVARLLAGHRGGPPADLDAAIDAVLAIAACAEDHRDSLVELDVNPLLVLPQGRGAVAADALIRLARQTEGT